MIPVQSSWRSRVGRRLAALDAFDLLMVGVSILGLALRCEHAFTFDGPGRGSDYEAHLGGVRWMLEHRRPFDFSPDLGLYKPSIGYQPPLWYALSAVILRAVHSERAIAYVAVVGWAIRQLILARILRHTIPTHRLSRLAALTINAVLPISVLTDGKVNPEGLHSTLFTLSLYYLWRMERQARGAAGISSGTATAFGAFAGLAVLTKATAGILPIVAGLVLTLRGYWIWRAGSYQQRGTTLGRGLARPTLVAAAVWCAVAGWWCGSNIWKYGHPFPHSWDRDTPATQPILAEPALYRRPLGWALPFTWGEYLRTPVIRTGSDPRPNLWAALVTGTWSDFYNRGFCRLRGGETRAGFWGGWAVSARCLRLFSWLARLGCLITLASVAGVFEAAWTGLRSAGQRGSLVLSVTAVLGVIFPSLFALVYPYDWAAVNNPRYLLPVSTAISACFGFALARWESGPATLRTIRWIELGAIALVALLVVYERWAA